MDVAHGMTNQCYCASAHYREDQKIHMPFDVLDSGNNMYDRLENAKSLLQQHKETLHTVEKNLLRLTKEMDVAKRKNDHKLLENLSKDKVDRENIVSNYKNKVGDAEFRIEKLNRENMEHKPCVIS